MGISYNPSIVTEGLVLGLDPQSTRSYVGSGTTWTDLTNNGNSGTLTNGPVFIPGGPFNNSGGSVYFDGNSDSFTVPASTDFTLDGEFTAEFWIYLNTIVLDSQHPSPITFSQSGGNKGQIYVNASNNYFGLWDGSSNVVTTGNNSITTGTWYHVAVTRDASNNCRIFLDGDLKQTASDSFTLGNASGDLRIGSYTGTGGDVNGYISNLRIIKGTALYTSNFTPPTGPLEAIDDTVLLTCQGGAITDNGPSSHAITVNNDAEAITASAFEFDGTNNGVTIPDNENFEIGTASSFECWININTVTTNRLLFGKGSTWWFSVGYTTLGGTSGEFNWLAYDGSSWTTLNTGVTVSANTWYHLVTTWDGTYFRFYANGNLEATSSDLSAKTWSNTTNTVDIGGFVSGLQQMTNQKLSVAKIYTKALTEDEVQRNFSALRGRYGI
jgi:hypothetical protein